MAVRTVSVTLKMQISDFELAAAKAAAVSKALGDDLDHMGASANKFSTAKPTKEMQNFSRVINSSLKDGKTAFDSIQQSIDDTKKHIADLKNQIRTGAGSTSIFGDLKQANKDLKTLENTFKEIGGEVEKAGASSSRSAGGFLGFLTSPVGIGAAATALPLLTAAVAAAVSAGVGLGVIGAGAFILRDDSRIQAALAPLKTDLISVFTSAAQPMVKPIIDALDSLDRFIHAEQTAFTGLFAAGAPAISLITKGVEGLVADLVPALTKVTETFTGALKDPSVQASLHAVSDGFVNIFTTIGNNPKEVADGFLILDSVITGTEKTISGLIAVVGPLIADLRQLRSVTSNTSQGGFDPGLTAAQIQPGAKLPPGVPSTGTHYVRVSQEAEAAAKAQGRFVDSNNAVTASTAITAKTVIFATGAMDDMLTRGVAPLGTSLNNLSAALRSVSGATEDFTRANIGVKQSLADLTTQVDANKKAHDKHALSLSIDTQTGRDNLNLVLNSIDANQKAYETQVAQEAPIKGTTQALKDANATYATNTATLEANLIKLGFSKKAVEALITANGKIPPAVSTTYNAPGLAKAKADAGEYGQNVRNIPHYWKTQIDTVYKTKGHPLAGAFAQSISRWGNLYEPAADGLLTHAQVYSPVNPGRFMIAEPATGGEGFVPKNGDYGRSMSIIKAEAGWYGASVVEGGGRGGGAINLYVMAGDDTSKALVKSLRYGISQGGGDPVRVLTPKGA